MTDAQGRPNSAQRIAELERRQATLEGERCRLLEVLESLPEGVIVLDREQRIQTANAAGRLLLEGLAHAKIGQVLARIGERSFAELAWSSPLEFLLEKPQRRVIEATLIHLEASDESWLLILRDRTDVREAIRRRDRYLALLSHELRNPLAALTSAVHLLRADNADAGVRERATNILVRQLRHIARLVDDLIDESRFLHGKVQLQPQPTDFAQLTAQVVEAHRPLFEEQGKSLAVDLGNEPLMIHGDSVRLTQVLENLLSNARRFTQPGEQTWVRCQADETHVVLRVIDTGTGIAAEKFAEIFEPFTQVLDTLDRAQGGLGLGLALVKALTEMHGGSVSVHSEGEGRGSEFTIRLPRLTVPSAAPSAALSSPPAEQGTRRRILIVEDENDVREMLQTYLQMSGHEVYSAPNGPEGLAAFRLHEPDVALIDIGLPGMDGFQLARALRAEERGTTARLIAVSGYARPEDRRQSQEAGFDLHLAKPVRLEELEQRLLSDVKPQRG